MIPLVEKEEKQYTTNMSILNHLEFFPKYHTVLDQLKSHFLRKLLIVCPSGVQSETQETAPWATSCLLLQVVTWTKHLNHPSNDLPEAGTSSTLLSSPASNLAREPCVTRRDMWKRVQVTQHPNQKGGDCVLKFGKTAPDSPVTWFSPQTNQHQQLPINSVLIYLG